MKLLLPLMPFLTEELWHDDLFGERAELECCIVASYPKAGKIDLALLQDVQIIKQIISEIRNIRNMKQISPKESLALDIRATSTVDYPKYTNIVSKLANVEKVDFVAEKVPGAASFIAGTDEFFVPLANNIDAAAERERLEKEIDYLKGFLKSVEAKLSNERFIQNAKSDIVDVERRKKEDALSKMRILEEGLAGLTN